MKISREWLGDWLSLDLDNDELSARLTMAGLEVDDVSPVALMQVAAVIACVEEIVPHPHSDRLKCCVVNFGGPLPAAVVCGAGNVVAGGRYPFVQPGTTLPDGTTIAIAEIRGVLSQGMLCSAAELGISEDASGLLALPSDAPLGVNLVDYLQLGDVVFDLSLTPNRGDCLSIRGVARELAVILNLPLSVPVLDAVEPCSLERVDVQLAAPTYCSRYSSRVVKGVSISTPTPTWMTERLRRCGVRSINVVVDVTNYVMLELGQPMHAFDLSKLSGGIIVRLATPGETIELLDGATFTLDGESLVIADQSGAIALAGVMGGLGSSVTAGTTDILLESAYFDPIKLSRTARHFALHTDAGHRFERGVDPALQAQAIERATALLRSIAGGEPGPCIDEIAGIHQPVGAVISFRPQRVARLLGLDVALPVVQDIFERLGMRVETSNDAWRVHAPSWRSDLTREVDLIEEVARIVGLDQLPVALPSARVQLALPSAVDMLHDARARLVDRGYFEAVTYSFIGDAVASAYAPGQDPIRLQNPIAKDMAVMRPSLVPGLLQALCANLNRQQTDVRLFETGLRFLRETGDLRQEPVLAAVAMGKLRPNEWGGDGRDVDFFDLKQDLWAVLRSLGQPVSEFTLEAGFHPAFHPGQGAFVRDAAKTVAIIGRMHPSFCKVLELDESPLAFEISLDALRKRVTAAFMPVSKFPSVRRDLAVVVDVSVPAQRVLGVVRRSAGVHLRDLQLFDVYQGQGIDSGKKSLALSLLFQASSSTLREEEVEHAIANTVAALVSEIGGALRT